MILAATEVVAAWPGDVPTKPNPTGRHCRTSPTASTPTPWRSHNRVDASHVCAALQRAELNESRYQPYTLAFDHVSLDEWLDLLLALNVPLRYRTRPPSLAADLADSPATAAATTPGCMPTAISGFAGYGGYVTASRCVR
jgi:hypothetical protein